MLHNMSHTFERSCPAHPAPARRALLLLFAIGGAGTAGAIALLRARGTAIADTHSTEGLLLAAGWWVAAVLFAWLITTAGAATVARALGAWRTATWLDIVTIPAVRKLVDRVLVITIAAGTIVPLAAQAANAAPARRTRVEQAVTAPLVRRHAEPEVRRHAEPEVRRHAEPEVRRHAEPEVRRHAEPEVRRHAEPQVRRHVQGAEPLAAPPIVRGATSTTSTTAATPPAHPAPAPQAPPTARAPRGAAGQASGNAHVVVRHDNLWSIAAARLEHAGSAADDAAIARYWHRVITRNETRLRSGNPNLIFPGEVIWLPPVDRAG
jgi:nucleoid-associated protein YgaU